MGPEEEQLPKEEEERRMRVLAQTVRTLACTVLHPLTLTKPYTGASACQIGSDWEACPHTSLKRSGKSAKSTSGLKKSVSTWTDSSRCVTIVSSAGADFTQTSTVRTRCQIHSGMMV